MKNPLARRGSRKEESVKESLYFNRKITSVYLMYVLYNRICYHSMNVVRRILVLEMSMPHKLSLTVTRWNLNSMRLLFSQHNLLLNKVNYYTSCNIRLLFIS